MIAIIKKSITELENFINNKDLIFNNLIQSFAPDTIDEAKTEVLSLFNHFPRIIF